MEVQPTSDLVSAFVTMNIPLFTDKRQDQNYAAAQYQVNDAKALCHYIYEQLDLLADYSLGWFGQYEYMQRANESLTTVVPITIGIIMLLLLYLSFKRVY